MIDKLVQVSNIRNLRRSRAVSIAYWIVFYSYAFIAGTKYFVFEEAEISSAFSFAASMQHIALISAIIVTFATVKRPSLHITKKSVNVCALLILILGCAYEPARIHIAYQVLLGIALGVGAASSLLTFIYELNNTERFFALVVSNVLVAVLAVFTYFYSRDTLAFSVFAAVLAAGACVLAFLEQKPTPTFDARRIPIRKKFYVTIVLAAIGGLFTVGGSLLLVGRAATIDQSHVLSFYAACALAAVLFFLCYKFLHQPVTMCLNIGFGASAISIFAYFLSSSAPWLMYVSTALSGVAFTLCMMTLYYAACLIIKKYDSKFFFKIVTIGANLVGGFVGALDAYLALNAANVVIDVLLSVCGTVSVLIIALSIYWGKSFSESEWQEDYLVFDTALTKDELCELYGLSAKEKELLDALLTEKTIKELSQELFITVDTVKSHRASIYRKLGVATRQELREKFNGAATVPPLS